MFEIKLGNKIFYYQVFYKKIKNMYLRVKDGNIIITTNKVPITKIEAFILMHENKLLQLLNMEKKSLYNNELALVFGKTYPVIIVLSKRNRITLSSEKIIVETKTVDIETSLWEKFYKELTLNKIASQMDDLSQLLLKKIDVRNIVFKAQLMKSRFGSCIPKKRTIKLNSILARFDEIYLQAVLLHEIIHLDIKGHQKDFYKLINEFVPNYKKLMKELHLKTREYKV